MTLEIWVRTTNPNWSRDWIPESRQYVQWGVKGLILDHSDSHGSCYLVEHLDGNQAWYEAGELELA